MKTARTDFFNQVSMAEDTSHSGETILGKNTEARRTAENRALHVISLLNPISSEDLDFFSGDSRRQFGFSPGEGSWAQKAFSTGGLRKSVTHSIATKNTIIEVIDLAPGVRPSSGIVADGTIVIDRFVVVQDRNKPEGAEGTIILHLSPTHAPVLSLITGELREDGAFTTTRLVTNQPYEGLDHMIAEVHNFVGKVSKGIESPEWVRNFDEKFKIIDSPQGYPTGPGLNNRRLAPKA